MTPLNRSSVSASAKETITGPGWLWFNLHEAGAVVAWALAEALVERYGGDTFAVLAARVAADRAAAR